MEEDADSFGGPGNVPLTEGGVDEDAVANAAMLILARESRGITQAELAEAMTRHSGETPVSQGYVSKAEAGRLEVTGPRLSLYADRAGLPGRRAVRRSPGPRRRCRPGPPPQAGLAGRAGTAAHPRGTGAGADADTRPARPRGHRAPPPVPPDRGGRLRHPVRRGHHAPPRVGTGARRRAAADPPHRGRRRASCGPRPRLARTGRGHPVDRRRPAAVPGQRARARRPVQVQPRARARPRDHARRAGPHRTPGTAG